MDEIANNAYIERKIRSIHFVREKILKVPINNLSELKLRNYSLFSSVYYSIFLSGIEAYVEDAKNLIFATSSVKMDPEKAIAYLNYIKIVQYIHAYYNKTSAQISEQFVNNINKTLFLNSEYTNLAGMYRYEKDDLAANIERLFNLYNEIETKDSIDPLLKAALFYIEFIKLSPFRVGNGRTARAIVLFYLFRSGYSLGGFFAPEKQLAIYRGRKFNATLSIALKGNNEIDQLPFIKFFLYSLNESAESLFKYIKNPSLIDLDDSFEKLSDRQKELISYLSNRGRINLSEYLIYISSDPSKANRDFDRLRDLGYIEKKGMGKSTYYILRKKI